MFLYEFAEKTAQKPDTVATYIRRNKKIFKNHVERRQKQIWLDEKAVDILLKKYPEVYKKQKKSLNKEKFEEIITKSLMTLYENQEILAKEIDEIRTLVEELEESFDHKQSEQQKEDNSLISLEKLFGEDTQVDRLTRQVKEQGEKIELLEREISVSFSCICIFLLLHIVYRLSKTSYHSQTPFQYNSCLYKMYFIVKRCFQWLKNTFLQFKRHVADM